MTKRRKQKPARKVVRRTITRRARPARVKATVATFMDGVQTVLQMVREEITNVPEYTRRQGALKLLVAKIERAHLGHQTICVSPEEITRARIGMERTAETVTASNFIQIPGQTQRQIEHHA